MTGPSQPGVIRLRQDQRSDLSVENEGTYILLEAVRREWLDASPFDPPDKFTVPPPDYSSVAATRRAIEAGGFMACPLSQDDGFIARLVYGEASEQEAGEWLGRIVWKLDLADGLLCVHQQWVAEVPPGEYRVEALSYLPHQNGAWLLDRGRGGKEPILDYWLRTRPAGEAPPLWLVEAMCEADWAKLGLGEKAEKSLRRELERHEQKCLEGAEPWVDFVFCLTPLTEQIEMPPLPKVSSRGDSFDLQFAWERRKPEACPRGLLAKGIRYPS